VISIERGFDPEEFTLIAFGGGGPLHACSLARALRIRRVLIPQMPGALSALGILLADTVRDYSRTVMITPDQDDSIEKMFLELERLGQEEFASEGLLATAGRSMDIRYRRQGYELNVPYDAGTPEAAVTAFHRLHQQRYGFCDVGRPVEIVNLRLRMTASTEPYLPTNTTPVPGDGSAALYASRPVYFDGQFVPARLYRRESLKCGDRIDGPALVTEYTSATVLPPNCALEVDGIGNLVVSIGEESA
jgi:N-methylhydantoinase A